ncbi:tetratricopeptide repeat protein [Herbidospora sp. RD11066]
MTSGFARDLARGLHCHRRGWYAEGARFASRAQVRASPKQLAEVAALWHALTRYDEAYEAASQAGDHLIMGDVERRRARYDPAEAHLRRAGDSVEARLALGVLCKETGRLDEAEGWYRRALDEAQGLTRADALHNLAGLAHARGIGDGEDHAREAVDIRRRILGPRHHLVATDLMVLGAVLAREEIFHEAMAILLASVGPDHYDVAVCQVNLAHLDRLAHRPEKERERLADALRVKRAVLGHDHPEVTRLTARSL